MYIYWNNWQIQKQKEKVFLPYQEGRQMGERMMKPVLHFWKLGFYFCTHYKFGVLTTIILLWPTYHSVIFTGMTSPNLTNTNQNLRVSVCWSVCVFLPLPSDLKVGAPQSSRFEKISVKQRSSSWTTKKWRYRRQYNVLLGWASTREWRGCPVYFQSA